MDGFAASEQWQEGIRVPRRPDPGSRQLTIRLAREPEFDAIAELFGPALEGYRGLGIDGMLDAYLRDLVDGVPERAEVAETYVALVAQRVVGSVAFYGDVALEGWSNFPAGWAGFRALVVDPPARSAGVGRSLVERCLLRGREAGASVLGIHSAEYLTDAVRLYDALGFFRCPEYDISASAAFPIDGADVTAIAFRYDLRGGGVGPHAVIGSGAT